MEGQIRKQIYNFFIQKNEETAAEIQYNFVHVKFPFLTVKNAMLVDKIFFRIFVLSLLLSLVSCVVNPNQPKTAGDTPPVLTDPVNTVDPAQALLITEIGSAYYADSSTWIEVYNRSAMTIKLSAYQLRATSRRISDNSLGWNITYDLPSLNILPGTYVLLRAKPYTDYVAGGNTQYLLKSSGSDTYTPRFSSGGNGFTEILYGGKTADYVKFGSSTDSPTSGSFSGVAPAVTSSNTNGYGFSIARTMANADNNSGSDWTYVATATPGGPNDVTDATDADNDGIPDVCEVSGSTFAGLPLYDWGARTGRKDIFIHVDYMSTTDPGILPRQIALDKVRDAFRARSMEVHFDVGDLFHQSSGIDTNTHDLSDTSHLVPYASAIALGDTGQGHANAYTYKNVYMPLARRNIFHYMIFANSQNANGTAGSSGVAELQGNDLIISLGQWFPSSTGSMTNYIVNFQAGTVMHELGHNLGLRHGGNENNNYKPNYFSIMNYLYQLNGLAVIGATSEGDRWYYENGSIKGITSYTLLSNGPDKSPALFAMDYSTGTGSSILESSINEANGLGRGGSAWIDYNNNSVNNAGVSMNLNASWSSTTGETLSDYNDWANLFLTFQRTYDGDSSGVSGEQAYGHVAPGFFVYKSMGSDKQPLAPVCPTPRKILFPK